jgi:hypothetical protein
MFLHDIFKAVSNKLPVNIKHNQTFMAKYLVGEKGVAAENCNHFPTYLGFIIQGQNEMFIITRVFCRN